MAPEPAVKTSPVVAQPTTACTTTSFATVVVIAVPLILDGVVTWPALTRLATSTIWEAEPANSTASTGNIPVAVLLIVTVQEPVPEFGAVACKKLGLPEKVP